MKLLVIGCGSIGRRHALNASVMAETGVMDEDGSRSADVAAETGVRDFGADLGAALEWGPDGVVVAVPHAWHTEIASRALEHGAEVLVEKPLAAEPRQARDLLEQAEAVGRRVYGVCNMRFHPAIQTLKESLPLIGRPLFSRAHFGNYLPNMRSGVDYRTLYAADADQGGVILDGIHELDYLSWFFGPIRSVVADTARLSDLEIAAEDYAGLVLRHDRGCRSEVHLDYLRRAKRRGCEIVGTEGILHWSSEGKTPERCRVSLYSPDTGWKALFVHDDLDAMEPLRRMMLDFTHALKGAQTELQTGREALTVLEFAYQARGGLHHE